VSTPPEEWRNGSGESRGQPPPAHRPLWGQPGLGGGPGTPGGRQLHWGSGGDAEQLPAAPAEAGQARPPLPPAGVPPTPPPAWTPSPWIETPATSPTPTRPAPVRWAGRLNGRAWAVVIVVLALTLVALVGAAGRRHGPAGGTTAAARTGGSDLGLPNTVDSTAPAEAETTDTGQAAPTDITGTTPEAPPTTATTTETGQVLPDGFAMVSGPGGVQVPIPATWSVHAGAVPTNLQADDPGRPGRFIRFGGDAMPLDDALAAVRMYERATPSIRTDYRRLRLARVSFGPIGEGVDWEFTFSKDGRQRHAYGRYWQQNGLLYVVYLSTWEDDWPDSHDILAEALNGASAS
jgi:hypothetical protein